MHQLFKAQATETPDNPTIVFGDEQISYSQLDQATDALGAYLRRCGVSTDDPVGIYMETCPEYIVASIGTLKAGAPFMPIALDLPDSLLGTLLSESQPKVVVTKARHLPRLSKFSGPRLLPVDSDQSWRAFAPANAEIRVDTGDLAFLPYTSGTTGQPKGVLQTNGALISSYVARCRFSSYSAGDRVACNIFFPWEFLRPLLKGGTVYVIPDDVVFAPRAVTKFIAEHRITEVLFTPSLLHGILNSTDRKQLRAALSSLRVVWLNGAGADVAVNLCHAASMGLCNTFHNTEMTVLGGVSYPPFVQQEKGVFSCKVNERTALDGNGLSSGSRKRGCRQAQDSG